MDKETFKTHFEKLVNVYGDVTVGFSSTFFETVEWMDPEDFAEAVAATIKSFTPGYGVKFPSPGHLLQTHNDLLRHRPRSDEIKRTEQEEEEDRAYRDVVRRIESLTPEDKEKLCALAYREYRHLVPEDVPDWMQWVVRRAQFHGQIMAYCRMNQIYLGLLIDEDAAEVKPLTRREIENYRKKTGAQS